MDKSNLVLHAEKELKLAGMFDNDADYGGALATSIVELVKVFSKQGHSGASARLSIAILVKLLRFQTLTPITSDKDEWTIVEEGLKDKNEKLWQSKRNPAMFSKDGGKTWYDVEKKLYANKTKDRQKRLGAG